VAGYNLHTETVNPSADVYPSEY